MHNANLLFGPQYCGLLATMIALTIPCGLFAQAGSLDPDFDADGMVTTSIGAVDDHAYSVAIQPDGRIVVAGYSYGTDHDFAVVRYNAVGSLDTTFSADGMVTTAITIAQSEAALRKARSD